MNHRLALVLVALAVFVLACRDEEPTPADDDTTAAADDDTAPAVTADVVGVAVTGDPGDYTFAVTLATDDVDCDQYADWWEVLTPAGELVYRRILTHSHPDEQPFTRDGGPVEVDADAEVVVRGHMNEAGYGGQAMRGSASVEFVLEPDLDAGFAPEVEGQDPQPDPCLF